MAVSRDPAMFLQLPSEFLMCPVIIFHCPWRTILSSELTLQTFLECGW